MLAMKTKILMEIVLSHKQVLAIFELLIYLLSV